ncbi:hypothetical protein [Streptomyces sp. UG1]
MSSVQPPSTLQQRITVDTITNAIALDALVSVALRLLPDRRPVSQQLH